MYDLLRRQVPGTRGRPAGLPPLVCLLCPPRPGRGLWREVGLGARNCFEPNEARGDPATAARLGRALWSLRSGRSTLPAGTRRRCSLVVLREDRGVRGCTRVLERMCANRVAREVGRVVYTQMLNQRGGIECDPTVTRPPTTIPDRHGHGLRQHDLAWIRQHAPTTDPCRSRTSRQRIPASRSGALEP